MRRALSADCIADISDKMLIYQNLFRAKNYEDYWGYAFNSLFIPVLGMACYLLACTSLLDVVVKTGWTAGPRQVMTESLG